MKICKHLIAVLFVVSIWSCNKKDNLLVEEEPTSEHIKYFGFSMVDTDWDDLTDTVAKTNYSDEVADFSNIADILVTDPEQFIVERMQYMDTLKMKSMLHLSEVFFEYVDNNASSGSNYNLRDDYQARWNQFVSTNNLKANKNLVQTFYIGEEPTWNGISYEELGLAAGYIKSSITEIPIMIIEAYTAIDSLQIPNSVDWIGFDHYFIKDPNNYPTYKMELNLLKSKFTTEDQKLVIVMDAHYNSFAHGDFGGITLKEMKNVATSYFNLAKTESKTIAILGYFWPSGFDGQTNIGARNFPEEVKNEHIRIGKEITGK